MKRLTMITLMMCLVEMSYGQDTISPCSMIERNIDESTNEVKLNSPRSTTLGIILKYIKDEKQNYYLRLFAKGSIVEYDIKGVTIIFSDGSKILKPMVKIKFDFDSSIGATGCRYSAFIPLTLLDLQKLSTTNISKIRLHIFDNEIDSIESEKFTQYVNCIKDMK
jgi:hypothetical protein